MAQWSRVWNTSIDSSCSTSCYNPLYPPRSPNGNVLDGFPLYIQTCGQAVHEFAQALKAALPANNIVPKYTSTGKYTLEIQINRKTTATATIQFSGTIGDYPVSATYTKGASSGSSSFVDLTDLLNWLVSSLRQ